MKTVDVSNMELVHRGKEWDMDADPSCRKMAKHLVRNEKLVTWLQPVEKGPQDQVPAIRVGEKFCPLSIRMMKAIWRDVRLQKGFVNLEPLSQGGFKPKIPEKLFLDKEKTKNRFRKMRQKEAALTEKKSKERRNTSIMTRRIHNFLRDIILPLGVDTSLLPTKTVFSFTEMDTMKEMFHQACVECPGLLKDRTKFLEEMGKMFDGYFATAAPARSGVSKKRKRL